ncbi:MAG TPA: TAXI family TRAP transporter solute-binding subunit [Stellaceae bacterium]|nr:TAXI family TRAP transporter solute-binding subunit [Stellaceae bacterium]
MKTMLRIATAIAALITACTGCGRPAAAETITLMAGPVGGVWYIVGAGMAKIIHDAYPDLSVRIEPGGAVANPARIGQGTADFALAITTPTVMAIRGTGMFHEKYPDIQAIAFGFAPSYIQTIATADFAYPDLGAAFRAKAPMRIAAPSTATLGHWIAVQTLTHYGASPEALRQWGGSISFVSHAQQQDLVRNGQANVLTTMLPAPGPDISLVASSQKMKFLPMTKGVVDMLVKEDAVEPATMGHDLYPDLIPAGQEIQSVVVASGLIVSPKVPEKIVYEVTRALFEHAAEVSAIHASIGPFVPEKLAKPGPRGNGEIPLAPGAERYFKEKGYAYKEAATQ